MPKTGHTSVSTAAERRRLTKVLRLVLFLCPALTRCNVDQTVEIHSTSHQRQFQFSMEAFKFIGSHDQVEDAAVHCSELIQNVLSDDPCTLVGQVSPEKNNLYTNSTAYTMFHLH